MGVQTARSDGIAIVRFDQPGVLNALSPPLLQDLIETLDDLRSTDIRGLVLTGAGGAFCSGANLLSVAEMSEGGFVEFIELIQEATRLLREIRSPTVAAIERCAVGGGLELALACDFRVAGRSATFGFPEVGLGLTITSGASRLLPLSVGLSRARQLLFLRDSVDAAYAESVGLIDEVCADGAAEQRANYILLGLAGESTRRALAEMREMLDWAIVGDLGEVYDREVQASRRVVAGMDLKQAYQSFRDRR